jgi:alpha-ribazole phosphatase
MRLYLVRHARPERVDSLCYGRGEVTVTSQDTAIAAECVRARLPASVLADAPIYTSPLSRCRDLAQVLAAGRPVQVSEDLAELDFGSWQGKAWDTVPRQEIDAWSKDLWGYRPGGGESARMAMARWLEWLERLPVSESALIITHAGLIRVALAARAGGDACLTSDIPYGSVFEAARTEFARTEYA